MGIACKDALEAWEMSELLRECAQQGAYVNVHDPSYFTDRLRCQNSRLLTKKSDTDELLACFFVTDKDYCADGLENKEFLCSSIGANEGRAVPPDTTKIIWISAVCTSPTHRCGGLASQLMDEVVSFASSLEAPNVIVAEAVRVENDNMHRFSQKRGFKCLPKSYCVSDFVEGASDGNMKWHILYRILR